MSQPFDIQPPHVPPPPEGWWEQVPVLREIYKLLSSTDPINWELARQVGIALATYDEPSVADLQADQREIEGMSRGAEMACQEFTGLLADASPSVHAVGRGRWVEENIATFKALFEPMAAKMSGGGTQGVPLPEPVGRLMQQATGITMGLQVGYVLGYLGQHVLGQYEVPLPHPSAGRLLYVVSNMQQVESDWELDHKEFRYWIALHEVTHHLEFGRPWARRYFHGQIRTFIESLDFGSERLQSMLGDFDMLQPEKLQEMLQNPEDFIRSAWTPLGEGAMARIQAFMTLAEGYSTWVMDAVGATVLEGHERLKEVRNRRKHQASAGEMLMERLLGIELKRQQYEQGLAFCRYVVGMRDVESLNRAWDNPDSLPTLDEIADPDAWITRVLD